eukprot:363403-Chlamydomonas_euryale.AAC.9
MHARLNVSWTTTTRGGPERTTPAATPPPPLSPPPLLVLLLGDGQELPGSDSVAAATAASRSASAPVPVRTAADAAGAAAAAPPDPAGSAAFMAARWRMPRAMRHTPGLRGGEGCGTRRGGGCRRRVGLVSRSPSATAVKPVGVPFACACAAAALAAAARAGRLPRVCPRDALPASSGAARPRRRRADGANASVAGRRDGQGLPKGGQEEPAREEGRGRNVRLGDGKDAVLSACSTECARARGIADPPHSTTICSPPQPQPPQSQLP